MEYFITRLYSVICRNIKTFLFPFRNISKNNCRKNQFFNKKGGKNLHISKIFCIFALDFEGEISAPNISISESK